MATPPKKGFDVASKRTQKRRVQEIKRILGLPTQLCLKVQLQRNSLQIQKRHVSGDV